MSAKILLVDDALFHRVKCRRILEGKGYKVLDASTGQDAIQICEAEEPDLILLDITMPDMNGIEVLKRIIELKPQARVIMLTAQAQQSFIAQALFMGAKDYITKPVSEKKLLSAIERILTGDF